MTQNPMSSSSFTALTGWLLLTFCCAALGAAGSIQAAGFYAQLQRPDWAPPAALFGPVWSLLYLTMGVAAWRALEPRARVRTSAVTAYLMQLGFNTLWSWLFFAWHLGALACVCIAVLWLLIVATIVLLGRRDRLAAWLLAPYLAWVSFAAALCFRIWQLNPGLLASAFPPLKD